MSFRRSSWCGRCGTGRPARRERTSGICRRGRLPWQGGPHRSARLLRGGHVSGGVSLHLAEATGGGHDQRTQRVETCLATGRSQHEEVRRKRGRERERKTTFLSGTPSGMRSVKEDNNHVYSAAPIPLPRNRQPEVLTSKTVFLALILLSVTTTAAAHRHPLPSEFSRVHG